MSGNSAYTRKDLQLLVGGADWLVDLKEEVSGVTFTATGRRASTPLLQAGQQYAQVTAGHNYSLGTLYGGPAAKTLAEHIDDTEVIAVARHTPSANARGWVGPVTLAGLDRDHQDNDLLVHRGVSLVTAGTQVYADTEATAVTLSSSNTSEDFSVLTGDEQAWIAWLDTTITSAITLRVSDGGGTDHDISVGASEEIGRIVRVDNAGSLDLTTGGDWTVRINPNPSGSNTVDLVVLVGSPRSTNP